MLKEAHFKRIELSDAILVVNINNYIGNSTNLEIEYAKKLKTYCDENNYQIAGDYICEVMTEFNVFDSNQRSMFLRLQVPVSFPK